MPSNSFNSKPITACLALLLGLSICSLPLLALAQEYHPPRRGLPGRRVGAGTRGETCLKGRQTLTPLTPIDGFSTTTSHNPVFFWYVPSTTAQTGEFVLLGSHGQVLHRAVIQLTGTPGIKSYRVPTGMMASKLTAGNDYRWQFTVICNANEPSSNPFVQGVIRRVASNTSLTRELNVVSPQDQATVYASAGIWQDAIATLAEQRCERPRDASLLARWTRLLQSVQLEKYSREPLSQFCTTIGSR